MDTLTAASAPVTDPRPGLALGLRRAELGRPGAPVLRGVDLDVRPGELLTVVGRSGCGKSTLLRTLAGLLPTLSGEATADGAAITGPDADRALVFQEDGLLPWRSVRGNVELPLAIRGLGRAERRDQAAGWLARVGLPDRARDLPQRLSGGQRQRVQLARALVGSPRAVLMDEPFGALDARTRGEMQLLLVDVLGETRATVVFVTHDVDEALLLGDRVALLGGGPVRTLDVPSPRDPDAAALPETLSLREQILASLRQS
ncbi:ABC transporter ATP-binding protein [Streptacidiphilus carbonis]|jgi:NitT/TauT family transport system ATP-binding protein|uniref:ABC transporter ATP-binding protein n=1 Tax=Streptacidiphilus carbonis TaxID=105422 RepID=UPI000AF495E8|nr:ABC transporter ATP-binding protein [Streptacidiphilus carbonis]